MVLLRYSTDDVPFLYRVSTSERPKSHGERPFWYNHSSNFRWSLILSISLNLHVSCFLICSTFLFLLRLVSYHFPRHAMGKLTMNGKSWFWTYCLNLGYLAMLVNVRSSTSLSIVGGNVFGLLHYLCALFVTMFIHIMNNTTDMIQSLTIIYSNICHLIILLRTVNVWLMTLKKDLIMPLTWCWTWYRFRALLMSWLWMDPYVLAIHTVVRSIPTIVSPISCVMALWVLYSLRRFLDWMFIVLINFQVGCVSPGNNNKDFFSSKLIKKIFWTGKCFLNRSPLV